MDFRDKDGGPLITWHDPSSAFEAWKRCSAGRPCDYTGLSHERLRSAPSGIQWPCDEKRPDGTERLYTDGIWWAHPDGRYPFWLTTGRTLYHFHTRTKTGRVPQLNDAAPDVWVEVSRTDADAHDLPDGAEGDAATRAANEATVTDWDPVSKQPIFKTCAARIRLVQRGDGTPAPAPTTTASSPIGTHAVPATAGGHSAHARSRIAGKPSGTSEGAHG